MASLMMQKHSLESMNVQIIIIQVAKVPSTVGPNAATSSRTIPVTVTTVQSRTVDGIRSALELVAEPTPSQVIF